MDISIIDEYLKKYAEKAPAEGMHIGYLSNASELLELYGDALSIMEDEKTPETEEKVRNIAQKIKKIVE